MASLGDLLRINREEKKISLDSIEDAIKVNRKVLEALEHDRIDPSFPPVYVRGFIVSYCRYLRLDENVALKLFEQRYQAPSKAPVVEEESKQKNARPRWRLLLVCGLGALVFLLLYLMLGRFSAERDATLSPPPPSEKTLPEPVLPEESIPKPPLPEGIAPELTSQELPAALDTLPPSSVPTEQVVAMGEKTPPTVSSPLSVQLASDAKAWMEVTIDDGAPFELMSFAGDSLSWEAAEKLELRIGNAGGVSLVVNKIRLRPFGKPNEVIRLLFTDNTVSINRGEPQLLELWRAIDQ